jgi:hypothetical protein
VSGSARRGHRVLGVVLTLPLVAWAATGLVFQFKPGYDEAYAPLAVKTYALNASSAATDPAWLEVRRLRTALGEHVLARTPAGWTHLDAATLRPRPAPTEDEVRRLLADAFTAHPARYGAVVSVERTTVRTDTGVTASLDWATLGLTQRGRDTDRIDFLYRLHYLRWTGLGPLDKALGFLGPALVIVLTALGLRLALKRD